jgi:glycosyltransferase involved in cell wall biosynthesis
MKKREESTADMHTPKIAVIIPTYNRAHCVRDAIDSVLAQSFQDYELVIVDDGSTDGTAGIVKAYGERLTLIRQDNGGASVARNTGIRASKAEWVSFLDSDDTWEPDKLKVHVEGLQKYPRAVAHLVDTAMEGRGRQPVSLFDLRGTRSAYERQPFRERPLLDVLTTQFHIQGCMLHRKTLEAAGYFDPALQTFEDIDLLARAALEGPFVVSVYRGVNLRWRPGAGSCLTQMYQHARQQGLQHIVDSCSRLQQDPRLTSEERQYLARYLSGARCELAEQFKFNRQWRAAIATFARSAADDPGFRSAVRALLSATGTTAFIDQLLRRKHNTFRRSEIS